IHSFNVTRIKSLSDDLLKEFSNSSDNSQYSAFNFYCPSCNEKSIDEFLNRDYSIQNKKENSIVVFSMNTKCKYVISNKTWKCPSCEKEHQNPVPIHKSLDEVFLPMFERLMQENKVVRDKFNSETRQKEIANKNEMRKEVETLYYQHLNEILSIQDKMKQLQVEIEGEKGAIHFINQMARDYRKVQSKLLSDIQEQNAKITEEINRRILETHKSIDSFKEKQMSEYNDKMNQISKAKRIEDEKRDEIQRGIFEGVKEQNRLTIEQTEAIDKGFSEQLSATQAQTNILNQQLDEAKKGNQNLENINASVKKGNAIKAAMAKKQGIDLHDESSWRLQKNLQNMAIDVTGFMKGQSTVEKEERKLNLN
ncbi:MAG TPA: hypothetical protein DDX98_14565, partial [Bacteroidales bacterium]|nr:hypothetical protein [Bacteroidales bacterium]